MRPSLLALALAAALCGCRKAEPAAAPPPAAPKCDCPPRGSACACPRCPADGGPGPCCCER